MIFLDQMTWENIDYMISPTFQCYTLGGNWPIKIFGWYIYKTTLQMSYIEGNYCHICPILVQITESYLVKGYLEHPWLSINNHTPVLTLWDNSAKLEGSGGLPELMQTSNEDRQHNVFTYELKSFTSQNCCGWQSSYL